MKAIKVILKLFLVALLLAFLNGEFFAHGLNLFLNPALITFYFVLGAILVFLSQRLRWSSLGIFLFGTVIGLLLETFLSRSIFATPPFVWGVNWFSVIIQIIYWGIFTSVIGLYLINRLKLFGKQSQISGGKVKLLDLMIAIYLLIEVLTGLFVPGSQYATLIWVFVGFIFFVPLIYLLFKR